jgi:uncharacterized protein (TIGR02118 family)
MHKLVILIEPLEDWAAFEEAWPKFLHLVEAMPGLKREASSRVSLPLFGKPYARVHELFFDSLSAVQAAMASENGRAAGRLIQQITSGKLALFIADHQEDDLDNIREFQTASKSPKSDQFPASEDENPQ